MHIKKILYSTLTAFVITLASINLATLACYALTSAGNSYPPTPGLVLLVVNGIGLVLALLVALFVALDGVHMRRIERERAEAAARRKQELLQQYERDLDVDSNTSVDT